MAVVISFIETATRTRGPMLTLAQADDTRKTTPHQKLCVALDEAGRGHRAASSTGRSGMVGLLPSGEWLVL